MNHLFEILKIIPLLEKAFNGNLLTDVEALIAQLKDIKTDCESCKNAPEAAE